MSFPYLDPTSSMGYPTYPGVAAAGNPAIQQQCYAYPYPVYNAPSGYGNPQFSYGYPSMPPAPPYGQPPVGGDPAMGGVTGLLAQLMDLFTSAFMSNGHHVEDPILPPDETLPEEPPAEEAPVDKRLSEIENLDPKVNSEALQILDVYSDELGAKNGKINEKTLQRFVRGDADVPAAVKEAAQQILDNDALYNLLCLKSNNDSSKGFSVRVLNDKWEDDLEIDEIESIGDEEDAIEELKKNADKIAELTGGAGSVDITRDDLEKIALGKAGYKLDDPELQAAAIAILSDEDLMEDLDTLNETTGAQDQAVDNSFSKAVFAKWLETEN